MEVQWAYEKLSKGAASVKQDFELSELQIYKQEIRAVLKEKERLWSDPGSLWELIRDDHRKKVITIDADVLMLLVDLAAHMSNLPSALRILQDATSLKVSVFPLRIPQTSNQIVLMPFIACNVPLACSE
jgi:hypothetical protein